MDEGRDFEYYWGEHIHLGYYNDDDLAKGAGTLLGHKVKDFIEAKEDFVDEMFKFSKAEKSKVTSVLDVGVALEVPVDAWRLYASAVVLKSRASL